MIKVVSFDIWGTLLDIKVMLSALTDEAAFLSGRSKEEAEKALLEARRKARVLKDSGKLEPLSAVSTCQKLFAESLNVDLDLIKRATARAVIKVDERIVLQKGLELLKLARKKNLKTACLGNVQFWPSAYTRIFLEKFGISDLIDKHFFSDETGVFKPEKEAFLNVVRSFGVRPDEVLHIGDREKEDLEGPIKAGLKAFLISDPNLKL